jgi:hypothetical protein
MPQRRWRSDAPNPDTSVLFVSEFVLRSYRDVPAMFRHSAAVLRLIKASDGALRAGLRAQVWRRTFHTRSLWRDQAAIDVFVAAEPHVAAMRALHPTFTTAAFASRDVPAGSYPTWRDVEAMLADAPAHRITV